MTILAGVGLSTRPDPEAAATEASAAALEAAGAARADLALVFLTPAYRPAYGRAVRRVRRSTGAAHLAGCTGRGVVAGDRAVEDAPAIAVLAVAGVEAEAFLVRGLKGRAAAAGHDVGARIAPHRTDRDALLLFPDPFGLDADALFAGVANEAGEMTTVGGAPAETGVRTHAFAGDEAADDSVGGVHLAGMRARVGVARSWSPLGPPGVVTAVQGRAIRSIDGRPAFDVLAERLPAPLRDDLRRALGRILVARPLDDGPASFEPGRCVARSVVGLDPGNGLVAVASTPAVGETVAFVAKEPVAAKADVERMAAALAGGPPPAFGLYFDCASRGARLYGTPGVDAAVLGRRLGRFPLAGVMGNAEIAPGPRGPVVHHFSGVLALFS